MSRNARANAERSGNFDAQADSDALARRSELIAQARLNVAASRVDDLRVAQRRERRVALHRIELVGQILDEQRRSPAAAAVEGERQVRDRHGLLLRSDFRVTGFEVLL